MTPRSDGEWIDVLQLSPHAEEGGFYRELYTANEVGVGGRPTFDTIYYMLTDRSPIGYFHRNSSTIVHAFHAGDALRYVTIDPDGRVTATVLGPDPTKDHRLQLVVPAGHWKATELTNGTFGLLSEVVVPAFDAADRVVATRRMLLDRFPDLSNDVLRLAYN